MMLTRTIEERVTFNNPFKVPGFKKLIPAGTYRINTMQELLEGLSFLVYRKTNIILYIPTDGVNSSSGERSVIFEPKDFEAFLLKDKIGSNDLFYRIKATIEGDKKLEQNDNQELLHEIQRGENEGMYIPLAP